MAPKGEKKSVSVPPIVPKMDLPLSHLIVPVAENKEDDLVKSAPLFPTSTQEIKVKSRPDSFSEEEDKPFFVRIDKFNLSKTNFLNINKKISELEEIMYTFEKIREKEQRDLEIWKEQLTSIKELLSGVDKEMFGKL